MPQIAVAIPTRNRPDHAEPCVRAVLANPEPDLEVILIDQSDDDATELAVAGHRADARFRYVRTSSRGASNARNLGLQLSQAPLIAFTDDDCRVAPDWLARIRTIFAQDPSAGIVYGRVRIPAQLRAGGFGAEFEPGDREYQGCYPSFAVPWGIGANMSVRRSLIDRIGAFDPLLGPGSPFHAGEEVDLMIRALAAGTKIVNAAEVEVAHLGVRTGDAASQLYRGYGVATGATLAKHVRLGTAGSLRFTVSSLAHFAWLALRNIVTGRRPTGLGMLAGTLRGMRRSIRQPIDTGRSVYADHATLLAQPTGSAAPRH
jgi:GT2 family glycosyltransferase